MSPHRSTSPTPARGMGHLATLSMAVAVVVLFGVWPLEGGDLLMHLTVGRWTWQHGGPPLVDVFSYSTAGQEFIAHSWLAGLLFYLTEQGAGVVGLGLLRFTLISVALLCAVRTATLMGAEWPAITILAPVVLGLMWARLEFRPQLFTTLLLAFQLWLLISIHTGHRSWRWLWVLPPIYALWVNLHGGWVQGMAMLGAVCVAWGVMALRGRWKNNGITVIRLFLILAACGLALLINPHGSRLLVFPFEMQSRGMAVSNPGNSEWRAPWLNANWQEVGGGRIVSMEPLFWLYVAVLVGVLLRVARRWRTADFVPMAVMGLWLMLSLRHLRAVSDMVLLTAPVVAAACTSGTCPRGSVWTQRIGIWLIVGLAALSLPYTRTHWDWRRVSVTDHLPCLATALDRHGLSGHFFSIRLNHWLLYFFPGVRVNSTWEYVAGPRDWAAMKITSAAGLHAHLSRYRVDVVLLSNGRDFDWRTYIPGLVARGWVVIHLDHDVILLVPHRPDTARLIEQEGYRWLYQVERWPATSAQAIALLAESERALRHCPQAGSAWIYKAYALWFLGFHDEAAAADRHVEALATARGIRLP